jgi:broad specificity phosphatase PhoE
MSFVQFIPENILKRSPVAVLMRHAERFPFTPGSEEDPLLTAKGHRDSYELGGSMKALAPLQVFHSPIMRCRQTAKELCRGLKDENESCTFSGEIEMLGPSLFVVDWDRMMSAIEEQGPSFLRLWFDGGISDDFMVPLETAAKKELDILSGQLSEDGVCTLNVSHDWNIMVLLEHYFNLRHEEIGCPGFLSAVVAYKEAGGLHLLYGEQSCTIDLPEQ